VDLKMAFKKLLILLVVFCFCFSMVSAFDFPLPVSGRVVGASGGLGVVVTNLRTGVSMNTITGMSGEFLVDWSNSDSKGDTISRYVKGDFFKVVIVSCENEGACVRSLEYVGQNELFFSFDLSGIVLSCPVCQVCPERIICPACPSCPEVIVCPEVIPCSVCEECIDETDYTGAGVGAVIGLLVGLVGGIGGGIKIYKKRDGSVSPLHKHVGIKEYHDINTKHLLKKYRHRLYKDDPEGFLFDVKIINDKGGLF
jgi:hypothetical protein